MPMPQPNEEWPPPHAQRAFAEIEEWSKQWVGTGAELQNYHTPGRPAGTPRKGFVNTIKNAFTQSENGNGVAAGRSATSVVLHLPVAADLARQFGKLMYGKPPLFKPAATTKTLATEIDPETGEELPTGEIVEVVDEQAQKRMDELLNGDRTAATLMLHGEAVSALGGGVLRVVWDQELVPEGPWIEHIDADLCIPGFSWNKLTDLLFWTEFKGQGDAVYRHFERYLPGAIEHALYKGKSDNVGTAVPLEGHHSTRDLIDTLTFYEEGSYIGVVETGFDKLAAVYVPNRQNPAWRKNQKLKMWGAADIANDVIPMLFAIDEVWSSLMRDIRQGKGRLIVSDSLVNLIGAGKGSWIDPDAEYLERVQDSMDDNGKPLIENIQFQIRQEAHLTVLDALLREVLRRVGISPLTFGLSEGVTAVTATEILANTRDTGGTIDGKRRLATPELTDLAEAIMAIDAELFGGPGCEDIDIQWPELVESSMEEKARTLAMIAEFISLYEAVKYLHPDWDDQQIKAEVQRIRDDRAASAPVDPFGFTEAPGPGDNGAAEQGDDVGRDQDNPAGS